MSGLQDPASHRDVLAFRFQEYDDGVKNGTIIPLIYPLFTYGTGFLFLFLLIPPSSSWNNRTFRYLTFAIVFAMNTWVINNCRANGPATAFGVGVTTAWGSVWAAALLLFKNPKVEFKRIERRPGKALVDQDQTDSIIMSREDLRRRNTFPSKSTAANSSATIDANDVSYVWQSYPIESFRHRFNWVADLVGSFRGIDWNWRISGLPTLPASVQTQLQEQREASTTIKDFSKSRAGLRRFDTYPALARHSLWNLATSYLVIDVLKIIIIHDPYFWGQTNSPAPAYLPTFIRDSEALTRFYRLFISQCGAWMVLRLIYSLGPLFFAGLLGPKYLGAYGEPWAYPDLWGSYANVLDRGIAGWWGGWWHQMFRYGFESGGLWVSTQLGLKPKSQVAQAVQLFVAFGLSGYIHACASKTSIGTTNPWEPFLFFLLQPVGILVEMFWRQQLKRWGIASRIPRPIAQATSFIYTHLWFYFTGPLLADDFAKAGVWLCEPVVLSPMRALGFGVDGDKAFCWGGWLAYWRSDSNPLLSGIAM